MLVLGRRPQQAIIIGCGITVRILDVDADTATWHIRTPEWELTEAVGVSAWIEPMDGVFVMLSSIQLHNGNYRVGIGIEAPKEIPILREELVTREDQ